MSSRNTRNGSVGLTIAALLASPTLGALVHTWDGSGGNDWHSNFNWNTNQVPEQGDAVIITDGFINTWVTLSANTALVNSIYVAGEMKLISNGHRVLVSGPIASTRIVQDGTVLQLQSSGGTKTLDTDTLNLESGGELWMAGGWAEIDEEFRILGDGLITGHGRIDVRGPQAAAFGAGAGDLVVDGGELRINMVNDGSMSLPFDMEITGAGNRLRLDGPFHSGLDNVTMGGGGRLSISEDWTLDGTLNVNQVGTATVDGAGRAELDGSITTSLFSTLLLNGEVDFNASGDLTLSQASTVELHDQWSVANGHQTVIGWASRLVIDDDSSSTFGWNGDIRMDGGFLEVNEQTSLNEYFEVDTGLLDNVPYLVGSAEVWFNGSVFVPADLAVFEADFESRPGSSLGIGPASVLQIAGTGTIRSGAQIVGSGLYHVTETGTLTADINEELGSNLLNAGRLEPGQPTGRFTITGDYEQTETGTLELEYSGVLLVQSDRVDVQGDVELAGTLEVDLLGGYTPVVGSSRIALTGNSITGEFDQVIGPAGMDVQYFPQAVWIFFNEPDCPWDVDGNGSVGFSDLSSLLALWGPCGGCPEDIDGNGEVGFADLTELLANWGGCP